jgi:hypothetical protein
MRQFNCASLRGMGCYLRTFFLGTLFGSALFAQPSTLVNPDFEQGQPGEPPLGWLFGFQPKLGYSTLTTTESCNAGNQCAMIRSNDPVGSEGHSFLFQSIDAKPYRGMKFRFRAAVRARVSGPPNGAGLLVRVHRDGGGSCFLDNMSDRRITNGDWVFYEIVGDVCADAHDLELGMQLWGSGTAWMDDASVVFAAPGSVLLPKITETIELPKK